MFSPTSSECFDTLTDGFIAILQEDILNQNPYLLAAQEKETELSTKAISDFACSQICIETIVPIFNSAAYPLIYQTDKITGKGKEGQALFDKPGQNYGGENATVGLIRKNRAQIRVKESQTYRISHN